MNGELVGAWFPARTGSSSFQYATEWLESPRVRALSLSLPILPGNSPHRGQHVDAWFDNLLPDSRQIRERIRRKFRTRSLHPFDLLAAIGRDCAGAVQILPAGSDPGYTYHIDADELTSAKVAGILRATVAPRLLASDDENDFRISIAGAQEKTALLRIGDRWYLPRDATPTTHILKLPLGLVGNVQADMKDSVENEWLCLHFLRALGLPVPDCEIARFEDEMGVMKALVVKRFDREFVEPGLEPAQAWIVRLPQEDICQATGTPPEDRYESDGGPGVLQILSVLQGGMEAQADSATFAKAQLAFWLLAAPDGHAKNFSIFLKRDGYSMTPLYDVVSAWPIIGKGANEWPYQQAKLAMAIRGTRPYRHLRKISVRHWEKLARETGAPETFREMVSIVEGSHEALDRLEKQLPSGFPEHVWDRVASGVRSHSERFLHVLRGADADII
ncbi:MAG: type II toxin-antitoxin system HipA family toxin [Gemmatimonadaceae bacterium]